ncbi:MAG: metallophosphoesterase family protein [Flavobacteriales bacterium]|nr:metallophosphoesterase family protein [Flavobacteriales bacterium]
MKRIGLLSDTHSFLDEAVLRHFEACDEIWHAGDIGSLKVTDALEKEKPLRAVFGNIDGADIRRVFKENLRFEIEGLKVWMTHIGGYPGNYSPLVRKEIYADPPGLFICGHSHILKVMMDKKLNCLHMNPGAMGNHGFHVVKTMLRFSIENGRVLDLDVFEKKRT